MLQIISSTENTATGHERVVVAADAEALTEALRLARGMTYKKALAGLPFGGGKSVITGDARA